MTSDEIAADLRRRIEAGREPPERRPSDALVPGSPIPAVTVLADVYGVSRETAHKAERQLESEGLLHTRRGRTTTVADNRPLWIIRGDAYDRSRREHPEGLTTFEQQAASMGQHARTQHHVDADLQPCPDFVANAFGVPEGTPVVHMCGEGWVYPAGPDGEPDDIHVHIAGIYDSWIPADIADACPLLRVGRTAENAAEWVGGSWSVIERGLGIDLKTRRLVIEGRTSTPGEQDRFGLPRPVQVLVETISASGAGRVLHVTRNVKLSGSVVWDLTLPIGD